MDKSQDSKMIVYTAAVVTESMDRYFWVYAKEPTREQVIERLWELEQCEDLEWYMETTGVTIREAEVL
jgi:hypothetical protein